MKIIETETKEVLAWDDIRKTKQKNQMVIIFGATGYGKSLFMETIIQDRKAAGYTIIVIDKKDKYEAAFAQFKPTEGYHLRKLKETGYDEETLKELAKNGNKEAQKILRNYTHPVKVYHPFTFKLPTHKVPNISIYTIPIKSLAETEVNYLLGHEDRNATFEIIIQGIKLLKEDEGLYHLMHKFQQLTERKTRRIGKDEIKLPDPNKWYLSGVSAGNITQIDELSNLFKPFDEHTILAEANNPLNLNMRSILNDNETVHLFNTEYLSESPYLQTFIHFFLIMEIRRNFKHAKHPVMVVYEEIGDALPKKPQKHIFIFSKNLKGMVRKERTEGFSFASTSQTIKEMDEGIRSLFTEAFFGFVGTEDLDEYGKRYRLHRDTLDTMKQLEEGQFILNKDQFRGIIRARLPTHAHKEEGVKYEDTYRQHCETQPDRFRMISLKPVIAQRKAYMTSTDAYFKELAHASLKRLEEAQKKLEKAREQEYQLKQSLEATKDATRQASTEEAQKRNTLLKKLWEEAQTPKDRSLNTLKEKLAALGYEIGRSQVANLLKKLELSTKKTNFDATPQK